MNAPHSPRKSTLLALLQPLGAAVGAVFAFGVLVLATRQGQFAGIVSFGAGAGVAALASVAVGGGTTFAYTTGAVDRQRAVRAVRSAIVLPAIALATGAAVLLYAVLGELDPLGVIAGGASVVASVSAELDASYLRRRLRTVPLLAADTLHRALAFTLMLLGAPFAFAMVAGSLFRSVLLRAAARADPSRLGARRVDRAVLALAYEARMTALSVLYALCDRAGALAAPLAAPVPVAGGFVAAVSAQQSASGVLLTGLQTTLAVRSEQRAALRWAAWLDSGLVLLGAAIALGMVLGREPLLGFLGLGGASAPEAYWLAVALLIPTSLASRLFEFRFLAGGTPRTAVAARAAATAVAGCAAFAALAATEIAILATGLVAAELLSILVSVAALSVRYVRTRRGRDHG